jgi:hypothetical protein
MMQTADLRDGHYSSDSAWLDGARVRAILVERQMGAGALVIIDIRGQNAAQMALVEDHDVIQAFTTDRTDHALDVLMRLAAPIELVPQSGKLFAAYLERVKWPTPNRLCPRIATLSSRWRRAIRRHCVA